MIVETADLDRYGPGLLPVVTVKAGAADRAKILNHFIAAIRLNTVGGRFAVDGDVFGGEISVGGMPGSS